MTLQSKTEREKLRELEEHYAKRQQEPATDPHVRELSLRSIKRLINQFKEEIIRYEARAGVRSGANGSE